MSTKGPKLVHELYRDIDGWDIPKSEVREVRKARSAETYGEIMPTATGQLIEHLELGENDSFVDLGCGVGKVVLHAALTVPLRSCVGIELARTRCRLARRAIRRARDRDLLLARACTIRCEDFMTARLDAATVVYTCSTAFPPALMRRLARKLALHPRPLRFVTLQDLDPHPRFELTDVLRLDMSWRRKAKVHVYRVTPAPRTKAARRRTKNGGSDAAPSPRR